MFTWQLGNAAVKSVHDRRLSVENGPDEQERSGEERERCHEQLRGDPRDEVLRAVSIQGPVIYGAGKAAYREGGIHARG